MSSHADVVKKSYLKLKVSKSSSSSAVQGPKAFKEFWFVFRALDGGAKILEYHQNERKFLDCPAYPKGVLHIGSSQAVSYHNPEKKQQFSIELADQSIIFLEAATSQLAREWMACLNAVLFGKGTGPNKALQYFVEVTVSSRLQYAGPCMLEVKGEDLIVKTKDGTANLVRWKLAHIRSFKAKKDLLTIYSGSRSSTGVGEYYFKTMQSVQITHAIETVVKKLKYEALGSNQQTMIPQHSMYHSASVPGLTRARPYASERQRPLPPPPAPSRPVPSPTSSPHQSPPHSIISVGSDASMTGVPDHIPNEFLESSDQFGRRRIGSDARKYIPTYRTPEYSVVGEASYQRLDHGNPPPSMRQSLSPPPSSQPAQGYSHLHHAPHSSPALPLQNTSPQASRSASHSPPPPLPPSRQQSLLGVCSEEAPYGRLDHGVRDPGQEKGNILQATEGYGRLGTPSPTMRKKAPPQVPTPYKAKEGSAIPAIIRSLTPSKERDEEGEMYSEVSDKAHVPAAGEGEGGVYSMVGGDAPQEGDEYDRLHVGPSSAAMAGVPVSQGYGRLVHGAGGPAHSNSPNNHAPLPSSGQPGEEYSTLATPQHPRSTFDPYGSLSDSNIHDLMQAGRQDLAGMAAEGGYSRLQMVAPPGVSHEVDDKGYSRPWTSFTVTSTGPNITPAPSMNGSTPQNGMKTGRSAGQTHQNGTETDPMYSAVGQPDEFEKPYEPPPTEDGGCGRPVPTPRLASKHSPSPPAPRRRDKKPLPSPPRPRPEAT